MTISSFEMRASKNTKNCMNTSKHTSHLPWRFWIRKPSKKLNRMATDAYRETQRYMANLQSIFDFPEEKLQISQDHEMLDGSDWEYLTANTFTCHIWSIWKVPCEGAAEFDRHLNEYERKFRVDQVGTYSVSSQHEQNHEDNQRKNDE